MTVFPLEIYEHILELYMEDGPHESLMMRYVLWRVCTAWRWKCRALAFRNLLFQSHSMVVMHLVRRKLTANPHLAALVENVQLRTHLAGSTYQSVIEGLPSILGQFLPQLRSVTIISSHMRPLRIHRHFSIRRIFLHTVTVLRVSNIAFNKDVTFRWFIAPFPSLRVLDLWSITWTVASDFTGTLPALIELDIGLGGNDGRTAWAKENRDAYERLLDAIGSTLRSLSLNVFSLHVMTSFHDFTSEEICLSALEVLGLEVHNERWLQFIGKDDKAVPFSQCISDLVAILARIDAKKTRILNISFDTSDGKNYIISDDCFLDSLRNVRRGLEDLVIGKHFPSLQVINIVIVGAGEALVPIWQDHFNACFPVLAERGLLHVKEYIYREGPPHRI